MEKYSCKASKLHLKPRRFKIFVEARTNFSKTERRMRGKDHPRRNIFLLPRLLFQINTSHLEVTQEQSKLFLLIVIIFKKKTVQGKASLARRNSHIGVSRTNNRGEASPTTSARQRRKSGVISAAAIKRWKKKAAMPGVSLVADVAEHLERTTGGNEKELAGSSDAVHIIKINKQNEQQSA